MVSASESMSLFHKLGGARAVRAVVELFYAKVMNDAELRPFFRGTDMFRQHVHQAAFIGAALGGPGYSGQGMREAHDGRGIRDEHFDAVAGHLVSALRDAGVPRIDVESIVAAIAPLRAEVVATETEASRADSLQPSLDGPESRCQPGLTQLPPRSTNTSVTRPE